MLKRIKGFTLIELLIVVAIIAILAAIAVPNFLEAQTRSKVARVNADLRSLATGIESYYVDNNSYPAHDSSRITNTNAGFGANNVLDASNCLLNMPTFRRKKDENDGVMTLTTPVAYVTTFFSDPFATTKRASFAYSTSGTGMAWILWSYGPDVDETQVLGGEPSGTPPHGGDIGLSFNQDRQKVTVSDSFYNPADATTPNATLSGVAYDSTNGTVSNGDVYRLKN